MSINLSLDLSQLKALIGQCELDEKLELIRVLEKDTYPVRFSQLLERLKLNDLTIEEITSEVETVRAKRYNGQKKA